MGYNIYFSELSSTSCYSRVIVTLLSDGSWNKVLVDSFEWT